MEDEVLAEQGEEASLVAGCRTLLRAVTKVGCISLPRQIIQTEGIYLNSIFLKNGEPDEVTSVTRLF